MPYIQKISKDTLGCHSSNEMPDGHWHKGSTTTVMCHYVEHLTSTRQDLVSGVEVAELIDSRLPQIWYSPLLYVIVEVSCCFLIMVQQLDKGSGCENAEPCDVYTLQFRCLDECIGRKPGFGPGPVFLESLCTASLVTLRPERTTIPALHEATHGVSHFLQHVRAISEDLLAAQPHHGSMPAR